MSRKRNKQQNKQKGFVLLALTIIAYLICAFILAIIHPDIPYSGIVFAELWMPTIFVFSGLTIMGALGKNIPLGYKVPINPIFLAYLIIFGIPLYFALDYKYLAEIDTDITNKNMKTAVAEVKRIDWRDKKNFLVSDDECHRDYICQEVELSHQPFLIDINGNIVGFYAGRNFYNRLSRELYKYVMYEYNPVHVKYISKKTYQPTYSLFLSIGLFKQKMERNIVYDIQFMKKPTTKEEERELQKLRQLFNQDYFISVYEAQRSNYIFFTILFFINALIFSWVIYRIKKNYLTE